MVGAIHYTNSKVNQKDKEMEAVITLIVIVVAGVICTLLPDNE